MPPPRERAQTSACEGLHPCPARPPAGLVPWSPALRVWHSRCPGHSGLLWEQGQDRCPSHPGQGALGVQLGHLGAQSWTAALLHGASAGSGGGPGEGRTGLGPAVQPCGWLLTLESAGPRAGPSLRAGLQASAFIGITGASGLRSWTPPHPNATPRPLLRLLSWRDTWGL